MLRYAGSWMTVFLMLQRRRHQRHRWAAPVTAVAVAATTTEQPCLRSSMYCAASATATCFTLDVTDREAVRSCYRVSRISRESHSARWMNGICVVLRYA